VKRLLVLVAACTPIASSGGGGTPAWVADTSSYQSPAAAPTTPAPKGSFIDPYRDTAAKILAHARTDRGAYQKLQYLTDRIGHRISGSPQLDAAIAWAVKAMQADGLEARTEMVMVPHWVRGLEDASITAPITRPLKIIGLGGTVATPRGGITAPLLVVKSFEDLEARAADAKGKLVLFDVPMPAWTEDKGSGYGEVARYRTRGASTAAKHGALGVLVRSVTAHSLRTPHTGALSYAKDQPKLPAAAVTVEDAMLLSRLAAEGPVTVKLVLESKLLPDAKSANVIGELKGREKPDEVVVIGGHIDSWDVGQGANDDGAGCVIVMQALATIKKLGLSPRRTIRVVLFTNEENGLRGGKAYLDAHKSELGNTVLALEADSGSFAPRGFSVEAKPETSKTAVANLAEIASLLAPLRATRVTAGHGGADIGGMVEHGVPTVGLDVDGRTYFDTHHTEADTLDKVDPQTLADDVAAVAVLAYIVADMPGRVDR
jgi:carboxypeptidase Q